MGAMRIAAQPHRAMGWSWFGRAIPALVALAFVAVVLSWLVAAVGVVPLLGGAAAIGMVLSVLVAWALVRT